MSSYSPSFLLTQYSKKPIEEHYKTISRLYDKLSDCQNRLVQQREELIMNELSTLQSKPKILKKSKQILQKKGGYIPIHERKANKPKNEQNLNSCHLSNNENNEEVKNIETTLDNNSEKQMTTENLHTELSTNQGSKVTAILQTENSKAACTYNLMKTDWNKLKKERMSTLFLERLEAEKKSCPFQPKINKINNKHEFQANLEERIVSFLEKKNEKIKKMEDDLTPGFKPELNEKTKKILERKKKKESNFFFVDLEEKRENRYNDLIERIKSWSVDCED